MAQETNLKVGDIRTIIADEPAPGYTFTGWTGDIAYLDNPSASTTTVTMPDADVTVTAGYSQTPGAPNVLLISASLLSSGTVNPIYSADGLFSFKHIPSDPGSSALKFCDISSDAMHLVFVDFSGTGVHFSHDGGETFFTSNLPTGTGNSQCVKISNDGNRIFVSYNGGGGFLSTNGGTSFSNVFSTTAQVYSCAMDSTGQYLAITALNGGYVSSDWGASWTKKMFSQCTGACSISSDGSIYMFVLTESSLQRSTDYGSTFSTVSTPPILRPYSISTSKNGRYCLYGSRNSSWQYQISQDHGATFSQTYTYPELANSNSISYTGISNDGSMYIFGQLFSLDGGITFTQSSLNPGNADGFAFADVISNVLT